VLYAADLLWWRRNLPALLAFGGLLACPVDAAAVDPRIKVAPLAWRNFASREASMQMEFGPAGEIGHGGHSGFQAINLAVHFGATRIALLGFDLHVAPRGPLHHYGEHPAPLRNPTPRLLAEWAKTLDRQAPALAAHGIELVNATPHSVLTAFPKMNVQEVVEKWGACPSPAA
jgi:hypothetical protein